MLIILCVHIHLRKFACCKKYLSEESSEGSQQLTVVTDAASGEACMQTRATYFSIKTKCKCNYFLLLDVSSPNECVETRRATNLHNNSLETMMNMLIDGDDEAGLFCLIVAGCGGFQNNIKYSRSFNQPAQKSALINDIRRANRGFFSAAARAQ